MIFVYLACLIIGGVLLLGSLLLGALQADADADHDADAGDLGDADIGDADVGDVDSDFDADHDASADHGDVDADAAGIWLPFFSLRFWVFSLSFFGLCGTLLTITQTGSIVTGIVSLFVGMICGTGAAYIVHRLGRADVTGDVPTSNEYIGVVGKVLVKVAPNGRGKIRVSIRNHSIDLVATTTDDEALESGASVLVVEFSDDIASITKAPLSTDGDGASR